MHLHIAFFLGMILFVVAILIVIVLMRYVHKEDMSDYERNILMYQQNIEMYQDPNLSPEEKDAIAIKQDWDMVMKDIEDVIDKDKEQSNDSL